MLVDEFADYLRRERRYSEHTVAAYRKDLQQFCDFCGIEGAAEEFDRVTMKEGRTWLAGLMRGGKDGRRRLSAVSCKRKLSGLRAFFRYLEKRGVVRENPFEEIPGPKLPKRLAVFVPEEKMEEVLESMDGGEDFRSLRDRLIVLMAYDTGMRRSELAGLRVESVDFARRCVRVRGKGDKWREVPALDELLDCARRYLALREEVAGSPGGAFFVTEKGKPMGDRSVYRVIHEALSADANLSKRSPHVLRHTFATVLLDNGAPLEGIKELLGHSSVKVTEVYTHNTIEKMKRVFKQAHPRA